MAISLGVYPIFRHTQIISQVSHLALRTPQTPHLEVFTEMPHAGSRFVEEAEGHVGELPRFQSRNKSTGPAMENIQKAMENHHV